MTPLHHALECAARGWAVFPVGKNKAPRTPNGYKAASTEPDRIKALHRDFSFVLLGVATGEVSNLAVLDIDCQNNGLEWWEANRHRLPATRTHRTRSGGLHLWFQHRLGLRCSASRIAPGVDVRAEGGFIIHWPAAGFPVLSDAPLAPWPVGLTPSEKPAPAPPSTSSGPRPVARIAAQLAGLIRTVAKAPKGQRNATLFWSACRAAELVAQGQLSQPHAEAALFVAASRAGLDHLEATRTVRSAFTRRAA